MVSLRRSFFLVLFFSCCSYARLDYLASVLQNLSYTQSIDFVQLLQDIKKLPLSGDAHTYKKADSFTAELLYDTADVFVKKRKETLQQGPWLKDSTGKLVGTPGYRFVQKIVLPAGAQIEFRGDLHGDVHSLINWLESLIDAKWLAQDNPFKIIKNDCYLAFLGDYADRGKYGAEVMFIIMQLYLHNPENILIVRGNHEDANIIMAPNGFYHELKAKFAIDYAGFKKITDIYEELPVAIFLGAKNNQGSIDFIQCNHGGMQPGYDIERLLDDPRDTLYEWINQKLDSDSAYRFKQAKTKLGSNALTRDAFNNLKKLVLDVQIQGFQWNDFDFFNASPHDFIFKVMPGRGFEIAQRYVDQVFGAINSDAQNNIWAVFRAHQHNGDTVKQIVKVGNGIYKNWPHEEIQFDPKKNEIKLDPYSVWTFNVAPRTGYYEKAIGKNIFNFDTVARLTLKPGFDNWKLQPRQIPVTR